MEAKVHIASDKVRYTERYIETEYVYQTAKAERQDGVIKVHPIDVSCQIRTQRQTPKLGVMLVGWGGNNGSTLTAAILANKLGLQWRTRSGIQHANYYGSLTQCSTIELCPGVQAPFSSVLPMVHPDDIALDGWDISGVNLYDSMVRAEVLDVQLQDQLKEYLVRLKPRPAVFDARFVAANQESRANNLLRGTKQELLDQLRADIRHFRRSSAADSIIVVWTATTERFSCVRSGLNTSAAELVRSVSDDCEEISPSTLYGMASVLEGCAFINGAPQNTCVPGLVELAEQQGVYIAGDDFKSGQTKLKSVLVDFLVSAGIKPVSIVSYNHLGNNDGLNLSAPQQFRSKEVTKSGVVEDMVSSNSLLYGPDESPDHCIVIKYVPYVGDSKRAMDEYTSEIMCGGHNTIVVHNTCEDSLLAAPIILDLVILTELFQRVQFRLPGEEEYHGFNSVLSVLGYLCKAPLVPEAAPVVNALFRQRACIENLMRACVGLAPVNNINLEHKLPKLSAQRWNEIVVQNSTRQQPSGGVAWKHNGRVQNGVAPILPADANGMKQNGGNVGKQQKPENGSE